MKIVNRKLSLAEFEEYVNKKDFGELPPTFMVIHHTWKPTVAQWQGQKSINGLKSYYEGKGWTAGPHLFIAEDGIWLFTDMYDVGIHTGAGNGNLKDGYSIGIEVVGNYDNKVWSGKTKDNALGAINVLRKKLDIKRSLIKFHRDYSTKTCPGTAITQAWLSAEIINPTEPIKTMNKDFVEIIERITKEDYGKNINENEQKDAAKKLKEYNNKYNATTFKAAVSKENRLCDAECSEFLRQKDIEISTNNVNWDTDIKAKNKVIDKLQKEINTIMQGGKELTFGACVTTAFQIIWDKVKNLKK
jgi:hypothetical protein